MLYPGRPVLYIVVCATPRARVIGKLVGSVVRGGWAPYVIATPQAMTFIDSDALAELTGAPEYKSPDAPDVLPDPYAVLACPASSTRFSCARHRST
ncbi:hypothetical protein ACIBQX_03905 [Nonomuraea sp. NPDC049714]|uniref:hypothetical protein n=1 Tax=Nonomuraea sp. NPDC049714 TaxID=3364357 RepID=UPI0037A7DA75